MRNLLLALAAVVICRVALSFYDSGSNDRLDGLILLEYTVTLALAAFVMIVGRPEWPVRAVGLFLIVVGTAWFFGAVIGLDWDTESSVDNTRAVFIVGAPLLLFGLLMWVKVKWFGPQPLPDTAEIDRSWMVGSTPYHGPERRHVDRREDDRLMRAKLEAYEREGGVK